jgi:hypothetical protein
MLHDLPLLGPRDQVHPRSPPAVDVSLESRYQLRCILDLIEDQGRGVVPQEEVRVILDAVEVLNRIEHKAPKLSTKELIEQRALANLASPGDESAGKGFGIGTKLRFDQPTVVFHVDILTLQFRFSRFLVGGE